MLLFLPRSQDTRNERLSAMSYYLDQVSPSPSPLSNQTLSTEPYFSQDESGASTSAVKNSKVLVLGGILILSASLFIAYYVYKEKRNVETFESLSTASKEITDAFEMTSFEQAEVATNNRRHKKKKQKKRIRFNRQKRRNSTKPLPLLKEEVELNFSSSRKDEITTIREEDEELEII